MLTQVLPCLIPYDIDGTKLGLSTVHAEHPAYIDTRPSDAGVKLGIDLTFIDLYDSR